MWRGDRMTRILHILPHAPPARCGVGDYAWLLAQALREGHEIESDFLVAGTTWTVPDVDSAFFIRRLPHRTSEALVKDLERSVASVDAILLHVSLYGYQKRGVPFWLSRAVRSVSVLPASPPIILMVHELAASGLPHTSAFWLRPLQEMILRQLVRGADAIFTNRKKYAEWLDHVHRPGGKSATVMPVFSNLGESPPWHEDKTRWRRLLVFASTVNASQMPLLSRLISGLDVSHVTWIGKAPPPAIASSIVVRHVPFLPAAEADGCLQEHGVAFTGYHPNYLAKSGLFAAFASHQMAVVLPFAPNELPDGLLRDQHFLVLSSLPSSVDLPGKLRLVASHLNEWYRDHDLRKTAASYSEAIQMLSGRRETSVV